MISKELQDAIDHFTISDVYLHNSSTTFSPGFNPKDFEGEKLSVQKKHYAREACVVEVNSHYRLRIFIDFGARWVHELDGNEDVKATIEAEYIAEYTMDGLLSEESINAFVLNNSSFHVWPYWREFLSSQCTRTHLPHTIIPTVQLAQNRLKKSESESSPSLLHP